ncbi:MAG: glycosyltransferase family 4 protein [Bacteroidales bacterium]
MDELPLRILQICNKPPYPPIDGGCLAMNVLSKGLIQKKQNLKILSMASEKHPVQKLSEDYIVETKFEAVDLDLRIRPIPAFLNLFTSSSYLMQRFLSDEFASKLEGILKENTFDIIQIETIYPALYIATIRKYSNAKIVIRAHNVEHYIWKRMSQTQANFFKRKYYALLAKRLKKEELAILNSVDGILPITQKDATIFKKLGVKPPLLTLPFALSDNLLPVETMPEVPSLFYIGAMNWLPNQEGLHWFLENVWMNINMIYPDLKFYIAGRSMPDWLANIKLPNVIILGEIEDVKLFFASKQVMIVPVLSGSGVRVKIIEGMTAAKMVITSTIGAEGIDYTDRKNIWIAETPLDYLNAVVAIVENPAIAEQIGQEARKLILEQHDSEVVLATLLNFYHQLLSSTVDR